MREFKNNQDVTLQAEEYLTNWKHINHVSVKKIERYEDKTFSTIGHTKNDWNHVL